MSQFVGEHWKKNDPHHQKAEALVSGLQQVNWTRSYSSHFFKVSSC